MINHELRDVVREPVYFNSRVYNAEPFFAAEHPDKLVFLKKYKSSIHLKREAGLNRLRGLDEANNTEIMLFEIGRVLGGLLSDFFPEYLFQEKITIAIPECGWGIGLGVAEAVGSELLFSNQGLSTDSSKPVLQPDLIKSIKPGTTIICVDDVLISGRTMKPLVDGFTTRRDLNLISLLGVANKDMARDLRLSLIAGLIPKTGFSSDLRNF